MISLGHICFNAIFFQEIWDIAQKVTCATADTNEKTVVFKPFVVDMLEVVSVPVSKGQVDCWMDIRRGAYPNVSKN